MQVFDSEGTIQWPLIKRAKQPTKWQYFCTKVSKLGSRIK